MLLWLESSHFKLSLILIIEQGVACLYAESAVGNYQKGSYLTTNSSFAEDYIRRDSCKYLKGLERQFNECLVCI